MANQPTPHRLALDRVEVTRAKVLVDRSPAQRGAEGERAAAVPDPASAATALLMGAGTGGMGTGPARTDAALSPSVELRIQMSHEWSLLVRRRQCLTAPSVHPIAGTVIFGCVETTA